MSAGDATVTSRHLSQRKNIRPPPIGPAHHAPPMQLPPDVQFCMSCSRGWPVAVFLASNDGTRDMAQSTCLECLSPGSYAQHWQKVRGKMARRIRRTELKAPERQARNHATQSMYVGKLALVEKDYAKDPTQETWQRVLKYRQLAAGAVDGQGAIAPPRSARPAQQHAAEAASTSAPLSAPAGSAVVTQMVYAQPQVFYSNHPVGSSAQGAGAQAGDATKDPASSDTRPANLAPTILRSIQEPLRSIIWYASFYSSTPALPRRRKARSDSRLKINYTFSQADSVSQNSVYAAYVQAISPGSPLQMPPGMDAYSQPVDPSRPAAYFPPAAMRGVELVSSIPRLFTGVRLSKVGFVCSSLRRKTEKERQELWGLIEPALLGSGADPVARALLSTKGGPGLAALANARPTPQPSAPSGSNPPLPNRTRAAGPIVAAARGQTSSSGSSTPPIPAQQGRPGSKGSRSADAVVADPLLPFRHRSSRPVSIGGSSDRAIATQGQAVYGNSPTVSATHASPAVASPAQPHAASPLPSTPAPHPMVANRTITPTTSTPTIPSKRKVLDISSQPSSPIPPKLPAPSRVTWATVNPSPARDSPPDGDFDPFVLKPPGSDSADPGDGPRSRGIVMNPLPDLFVAAPPIPASKNRARAGLGSAIDDAIEID